MDLAYVSSTILTSTQQPFLFWSSSSCHCINDRRMKYEKQWIEPQQKLTSQKKKKINEPTNYHIFKYFISFISIHLCKLVFVFV